MKIELSAAGAGYLLKKLEIDVEYYGTLAGHPECSMGNRLNWEVVKELEKRLREVVEGTGG
jgi:hypothetical protein